MAYAKIRLKESIKRTFRASTERNYWPEGTEFYIRQERPGCGMVVQEGPDQGLGVPEKAAEVLEAYESLGDMARAAETEPKEWYRVSGPNWTHYFRLTEQQAKNHRFFGNAAIAALPPNESGMTCLDR